MARPLPGVRPIVGFRRTKASKMGRDTPRFPPDPGRPDSHVPFRPERPVQRPNAGKAGPVPIAEIAAASVQPE
jgi:hypothetical protein